MKRLLKIREFFDLKKRDTEKNHDVSDGGRQAKRARTGEKQDDGYPSSATKPSVNTAPKGYERFLQAFEKETAKDSVWWLPWRRGEAFAMHKERFEQNLLKIHFEQRSFADFLKDLKLWGFQQMNIPSLSGRILTFEKCSKGGLDHCTSQEDKDATQESTGSQNRIPLPQEQTLAPAGITNQSSEGLSPSEMSRQFTTLSAVEVQQAHYMVQQEIAHTYFSLLWQELQRQLTVLLLQQSQIPQDDPQAAAAAPRSEILDLAALLHQQQMQQQLMAAQFIRAAFVQPTTPGEQQAVAREVNELQQQQLSNLTYQIIALVAANLEQQNQDPPMPEAPMIHRILVKYMIALVLLQLQQQQHNLEFLRQERLGALALARANSSSGDGGTLPDPLNTLQMQQLLSEAAMLSLSRAHQLLGEAALLMPDTGLPPQPDQLPHPGTPPPPFPGSGFSQGPHPSRTTTAR